MHPNQASSKSDDALARRAIEGDTRSVAEQMADIMVNMANEGCRLQHLLEQGFSLSDITTFGDEAALIAARHFVRQQESPAYNRSARVIRAAKQIKGMLPSNEFIKCVLGNHGFSTTELGDILAEAIALAADEFAGHSGDAQ